MVAIKYYCYCTVHKNSMLIVRMSKVYAVFSISVLRPYNYDNSV